MIIVDAFQMKGNKHPIITSIRLDRDLTGKERRSETAIIGNNNLTISIGSTSLADLMWTGDEIQDPKALIGQEIILL